MPRNRKDSTVRSTDKDHPGNTDLTEELKEGRRPLFRDGCKAVLLFLIVPLLLYIPILVTRAMTQVKNGITPFNPFPWFLSDFFMCVIIICLIILAIFFLGPGDAKKAKLCAVIASISVLLIVLFELSANRRFINQLFIDAMSSQQSDNQQTSPDQPLSPDEVKQPATDPATEPSNDATAPNQSDKRSAGQVEHDNILALVKQVAKTVPNFHPTTVRRSIQRLSIDPNTPVPPHARIPIKTLVVAQLLLLVAFPPYFEKSSTDSVLHDVVDVVLRLFVCLLPTITALNGLQIIRVRWIFIPLPLLVFPLLRIDKATQPYRKIEGIISILGAPIIVLYVGVFYLIGAFIADGVLSWSFSVSTFGIIVPILVDMVLLLIEEVWLPILDSVTVEDTCYNVLLCLICTPFIILPFAVIEPLFQIVNGFTPLNPFPWFYFDNLICVIIISLIILSIFYFGPGEVKKAKLCAVIASVSVLLIFLFEMNANARFIDQLSIDAMSSQQSDNQQTSTDQPLSPDEVEQPATDPATEPSNETISSAQSDERSARQIEQDYLLEVAKKISETMPNIELTTIQRFMKQLSVDRNAPLPPRSRIPIKTLVVAEILLLVFIASDFHNHVDSCLSAAAYVVFVLCVCAIPVVIALIGMQLIHVPLWVLLVVGGIGVLSGMFVFGSYRVSVEMHVERRVRPDDSDTSPTKHVRNSVEREPED